MECYRVNVQDGQWTFSCYRVNVPEMDNGSFHVVVLMFQ